MLNTIKKLLKPPPLADPNQARLAEVLHTISISILVILVVITLLTPFVFVNPIIGLMSTFSIFLLMISIQLLIRRGSVRAASWLFSVGLWSVDLGILIISGGISGNPLAGFVAVSILAGLLLGKKYAFIFAGGSMAATTFLFFMQAANAFPAPVFTLSPLAHVFNFAANLGLSVAVLYLVMKSVDDIFELYIDKERSLSRANRELKKEIQSRNETEDLLKQSEARFRSAVMNSPYPIMLHAEGGEVLLVNKSWTDISGYRQEEVPTIEAWTKAAYRENAKRISGVISQLYQREGAIEEGQFDIYTKKGQIRNWYFSSAPLPKLPDGRRMVMSMAMDITELRKAEAALRKSEERFTKVTLATNDGIWDWNLITDEVFFDPHYYLMAGYKVNAFPHQLEEFRQRVHPDDVDYVFKEAEDHLQGRSDQFNVEFRFQKQDGSWLWVQGRGKIIEQDHQGNPTRFIGTHTDISDRKEIEKALERYRTQLENLVRDRTQKLEDRVREVERLNEALTNLLEDFQKANLKLTKTTEALQESNQELESFTYSVSHDLRAPLRAIEGFSRILMDEYQSEINQEAEHYLNLVRKNAQQMDQLIKDLLELSRLGRKAVRKININPSEMVAELIDAIQEENTQRKIDFVIHDLPACKADPRLLNQVFYNLISNAVKFTQNRENACVEIGAVQDQTQQDENKITYFIKDNGVGFDMTYQGKLFGTFQRLHTEEEFQGTGVGLAIAKRIIDRHGGKIWADGEEGQGATFYFKLDQTNHNQF